MIARAVSVATLVRGCRPTAAMPLSRFELSDRQWAEMAERLRSDPIVAAGVWSDGDQVHVLLLESPDAPLVASVAVDNKRVQALSPSRPALAVPERILRDLWGIEAMDALDLRPWLDHGVWKQTAPLSARPGPAAWPPEPPEFEWSEADAASGAMQLPIGPVQDMLHGPAQLRVTLAGERVRRLEPLLGFNHRGVAMRLRGAATTEAARLVGRIDAGTCVAHQLAFAQAMEAACFRVADGGTRALRESMLALERIGAHLRRARMTRWRALLEEGCAAAFGHRLMRDAIIPGGWASPPDPWGLGAVSDLLSRLEAAPESLSMLALFRRDIGIARKGFGTTPAATEPVQLQATGIREGLGAADTIHGPLWHWVRVENGRLTAWHAVDPVLARLSELVARAPGATLEQLRARFEAADLSVPGADQ